MSCHFQRHFLCIFDTSLIWYCSLISRAAYKRDKFSMNPDHVTDAFNLFNRALLQNLIRDFITLIFEVLLMLSQHLLHNTLICIVSDKGVHNDSHYTDVTGEFGFLSAPPLLQDSSIHDDYKRRCWPIQLTLNQIKELTEEDVALTMTEFTWKIMPHRKTLNKRVMSSCVGTVSLLRCSYVSSDLVTRDERALT